MSYCRFENTAKDLEDCIDNWKLEDDASKMEIVAREHIVQMAQDIIDIKN